ncbi:hypothetical protein C8R47DRAFT_1016740 [Mycena vitilis]|nr:hypothetical protein C8R47DRAFT_1016740 [Mycena vitilis]
MPPEVIDLTGDSPPPSKAADPQREAKRARKRERRKKRNEVEAGGEPRESHEEERDSRHSDRHSRRSRDDGKRHRESSRERDPDRKRARRERDRERERDPEVVVPDKQLFFIDATPAALPSAARYAATATLEESPGLILPAHVSVFGETPATILPAEPLDSDEDDYIEYLEYDNRKDFVRYYEEKPEEKQRTTNVCKKCGAKGEHTTAECTVLICLTCGARDQHPTRLCNVSKTCFNCGMKGHINVDCPNRNTNHPRAWDGCERCNSSSHLTSECPTLWRLYVYVEDDERQHILQIRKGRKGLPLGQGGEGYIADDAWCYNCGGSGHWGDDCREFYHSEPLSEPTAFSYQVLSGGPFSVTEHMLKSETPREWEREVSLPGGVENVGRQARKKEMEKLTRRAQQQEADDDPVDWFQSSRDGRNRGGSRGNIPAPRQAAGPSKEPPRVFKFGAAASSKVSLSDRLTDPIPRGATSASLRDRDSRDRASDSRRRNERDSHNERERDRDRRPRYRGGYSRS